MFAALGRYLDQQAINTTTRRQTHGVQHWQPFVNEDITHQMS